MNKRLLLGVFVMFSLLAVAFVSADNYANVERDVINTVWSTNTGGETGMYGMQIDINRSASGINVSLGQGSTMTRSCLYYSNNQSQIGSCQTLVNRQAQYNFTISSGQSFRIMFDNNGATYTRVYQSSSNFKGTVIGNITLERRWYYDGATWQSFGSDESTYEALTNVTVFDIGGGGGGGGSYSGPNLTLSVNDTRTGSLVSGFSYNYSTSNASDTNTKWGYCSGTACIVTNISSTQINISVSNISSGSYFNTSLTTALTSTGTVYAQTFSNSVNFTNVYNILNLSNVTSYCVQAGDSNGTWRYGCTNGTGSGLRFYNMIGTISYNFTNISGNTYFNVSGTLANFNQTLGNISAASWMSWINVSVYQYITNQTILNFTIQNFQNVSNTSNGSILVPANNGSNSLSVRVLGNYTINFTCSGTVVSTNPCNITGIYDSIVNISLKNAWSLASVSNFSGWYYGPYAGSNLSYSTTNGTAYFPMLMGRNITTYITAPGYSLGSNNTQNLTVNSTQFSYTFYLYSNNSIVFSIFKQSDGTPIYDNITIVATGSSGSTTNWTTSGVGIFENLRDDIYTLAFSGLNWSTTTYTVTVTDSSTQTLNAYLPTNTTSQLVIQFIDYETTQPLQNVTLSVYRIVNGSKVLIESRTSDVSGYAVVNYLGSTRYDYIASLNGYVPSQWTFNPVLFSTYTIKLLSTTSSTSSTTDIQSQVYYSPSKYYVNQTNNFSIVFYSRLGALAAYNVSVTYPGGQYNNSGIDSQGSVWNTTINITSASWGDMVNVSYCYRNTYSSIQCFSFQHDIIGVYGNQTMMALKDNTYGLGLLERILVVTIIAMIFSVFFMIFFSVEGGMVAGIAAYALFTWLGFVPIWLFIITFIGVGLLLFRVNT